MEVLYPSDTALDVEDKVEEYLAAGSRAVWVINPTLRRVTVYQPAAAPQVLNENDTLKGDDVLPGFECPVRDIFTWPV